MRREDYICRNMETVEGIAMVQDEESGHVCRKTVVAYGRADNDRQALRLFKATLAEYGYVVLDVVSWSNGKRLFCMPKDTFAKLSGLYVPCGGGSIRKVNFNG